MLQITEDTPPDMLAGAMDLTVHLPTGRSVRMAVERSTPMMDLLVQITTNHHLQLSNHTLQALGMAPSAEHSDRVLPYKPNTPIGALDTQHIKVIPKTRTLPAPKNVAPGHQPFESTFRLKVHLPRNQLYVTRVSRNVLLEDIMKKVCEEKNLDPIKYEFKHPGNLDEVLDPKLTLSDYQITEIYVVAKGTISLNQAFSTSDIMALRKEEERKQMHNKTGGGVFNLIFRRGKSSMGSGSLSSENRSISPTHSDDSRSVTPPAVQPAIIVPPPKLEPTQDRPKPPQRKRRPAPKPPQTSSAPDHEARKSCSDNDKPPSNISVTEQSNEELQRKIVDSNGLTICHSRNSSDSSGYHEASILSDNCNTSLPRRPKSAYINGEVDNKLGKLSRSTTNLTQMAPQSKSTSSLAFTGRKKKAAPPPPPALKSSNSVASLAAPSPIVASQPPAPQPEIQGRHFTLPLRSSKCIKKYTMNKSKKGTNDLFNGKIFEYLYKFRPFNNNVVSKQRIVKTQTLGQIYCKANEDRLSFSKVRNLSSGDLEDLSLTKRSEDTDLDNRDDCRQIITDDNSSKLCYSSSEQNNTCTSNSLECSEEVSSSDSDDSNTLVYSLESSKIPSSNECQVNAEEMQISSEVGSLKVPNVQEPDNNNIENSFSEKSPVKFEINLSKPEIIIEQTATVLENTNSHFNKVGSKRRIASSRKLPSKGKANIVQKYLNNVSPVRSKIESKAIERNNENWKQFISKLDKIMVNKASEFI